MLERLCLALAEWVTPPGYFVQMLPNTLRQAPAALHTLQRRYNRATSEAFDQAIADGSRVIALVQLLNRVRALTHGDYAEVGTWKGFSARILFEHLPIGSTLHCFDTFTGFDPRDLAQDVGGLPDWLQPGHFSDTSADAARDYIRGEEMHSGRLQLHAGFFPDTFDGLEEHAWRFVHLDADLYAPTLAALERFWPRLVPGGVLVVHDYANEMYYEGVARALDLFCYRRSLMPVTLPDKAGSAVLIKPYAVPRSIFSGGISS